MISIVPAVRSALATAKIARHNSHRLCTGPEIRRPAFDRPDGRENISVREKPPLAAGINLVKILLWGLLAVSVMAVPMAAHAQLTSVDGGTAAVDNNGLMWANVLGSNFGESGPLSWSSTAATGSAQAWVLSLDSSNYGGYSDWTLATGNGTVAANTTTNQISELFNSDCGNPAGSPTAFGNPGKSCGALSAIINAQPMSPFGGSLYLTSSAIACSDPARCFWAYDTATSSNRGWTGDTAYSQFSGSGYALAVRKVSAPEIDPRSTLAGLVLLLGSLAVVRGRNLRVSQH
jgi:hypothetical protein